jgi:hypothetical protein
MILDGVVLNRYHKELIMTNRKLRIESLEQRTLLAVLAGGSEQIAEFGSGPSAPTEAVTWVVNTTEDPTSWETGDDLLSLREAIGRAAAGDTITFDSALAAGTITLSGTQLGISTGITIDASGIGGMTIDGNGQSRVFVVDGSADECRVELTAITITGGNVTDSGGGNCTVVGNTAGSGGGIDNSKKTSLYNSVILGITSSKTISAYNTLSDFTAWTESSECLTYDAAKPLFTDPENGDYTLAEGSQAINQGNNDYATVETDLAGDPRICHDIVDLGAYEYQRGLEPFASPTISTGTSGVYVSYGANRHRITWNAVENAENYELAYSADGGFTWLTVAAAETSAVITGLSYGVEITYRVRVLGIGAYADSEWSASKTFMVCPMDINGDGDISNSDRALLSPAWLSEEGDDNFRHCCDIDGNGEITNSERAFLAANWLAESKDDGLVYPVSQAADAVFGEYTSADLGIELDVF